MKLYYSPGARSLAALSKVREALVVGSLIVAEFEGGAT